MVTYTPVQGSEDSFNGSPFPCFVTVETFVDEPGFLDNVLAFLKCHDFI